MKNQKTCFNCLWYCGTVGYWDYWHRILCDNPPSENIKSDAKPCINWQEQISLELAEEMLNAEARQMQS